MEFFTVDFVVALGVIILIDLVLAGDNAIVIGLAARNVPEQSQRKVILWGTAGAVLIRILATLLVVKLLSLPWLHLIGGLLLIWIAIKLLTDSKQHGIQAKTTVSAAIWTIIIADAAMGIDNVLAIAAAADGSMLLVILGLLISIPIMVWGSTILIKWMNRFPAIIYIGAGVIAWTAANMITKEEVIIPFFTAYPTVKWLVIGLVVLSVIVVGHWINSAKHSAEQMAEHIVGHTAEAEHAADKTE